MKHLFLFCLLLSFIFVSCKETVVENPVQDGSLLVNSKPQGGKIFLQGTFEGHYTPYTFSSLAPHEYDITVEVEPGVDSSFVMNVKPYLTASKTIDFESKMGRCYFQSNPAGAKIYVDGNNSNEITPAIIGYLTAGMHSYRLQLGNITYENSFMISPGQLINVNPVLVMQTGSIFVISNPAGAEILIDGSYTGLVTPDSVAGLSTGYHMVTLILDGYRDTSFAANVQPNLQTNIYISMTSTLSITLFGPVRIYETSGTTSSQLSGLDLSSGTAYGMSGGDKNKIDIYYSTDGTGGMPYLVQSADLFQNLYRQTRFFTGNGSDLNDGLDSPAYPVGGSWTNYMEVTDAHYVFLYDDDGNYSKLIITNFHNGIGPGDPSWLEVMWLYNNTGADTRF